MVGNQRSNSNTRAARRCSAVSSGGSITVGRLPATPVVVRTSVARISARLFIVCCAEALVPSATFDKLTSISPSTVAKVCKRNEPSAH